MMAPCPTCKVRHCCVARAATTRDAVFEWAYGRLLDCEDYEPDLYHGLEGVIDAACLDRVSGGCADGRGYGRDSVDSQYHVLAAGVR